MSDKSPDAFRTISEVADWLGVQPHVLRFWESKFSQVRPVKRAGGRRYYRPNDMLLLGGIRKLLHEDGLTIKGAQKVLREEGMSHVARLSQPLDPESAALSDMAASYEESAGDEPQSAAPEEPETGQLVDFHAARTSGTEPTQSPKADKSTPDREPAEDRTVPPAAKLSGSSSANPQSSGGDDPSSPRPAGAESPEESDRTSDPAAEPEQASPREAALPSFMRGGGAQKLAEPEKSAGPASDRLPSFLKPPPAQPGLFENGSDDDSPAATPGDRTTDPAGGEDPADGAAIGAEPTDSAAPRPRIVDAPDPDESAFDVRAGALSASHSATALSQRQRAEILPLVSQLAALRDRMAAGRGR